jgi:hypothetical protein
VGSVSQWHLAENRADLSIVLESCALRLKGSVDSGPGGVEQLGEVADGTLASPSADRTHSTRQLICPTPPQSVTRTASSPNWPDCP